MLELTVRLVVSLSLVIGLLLLLAKLGGRRFRGKHDALVRVLHRHQLSRGSTVSVVAVGSRVLVLGATEHQVRVLTELDPEEIAGHEAAVLSLTETVDDDDDETAAAPKAAVPAAPRGTNALAGSVLSAATWKQALAAATRRSS